MFATQQKSQRSSLHSLDTLLWKITQPDDHHVFASSLERKTRGKRLRSCLAEKLKQMPDYYLAQKRVKIILILECIYASTMAFHFPLFCLSMSVALPEI